jgi:hypothetical protein
VPVTATAATVQVGGQTSASGALPLNLPFSYSNSGCGANGSVTVSIVDGALQLDTNGTIVGTGSCSLAISADVPEIQMSVPNVGESMTPVLFSGVASNASGTNGVVASDFTVIVDGVFRSALVGEMGCPGCAGLPLALLDAHQAGDRQSTPILLIPDDMVSFSTSGASGFLVFFSDETAPTNGTFSGSYRLEAFLPPDVSIVASLGPIGRKTSGMLILGIGIGFLLARRRRI